MENEKNVIGLIDTLNARRHILNSCCDSKEDLQFIQTDLQSHAVQVFATYGRCVVGSRNLMEGQFVRLTNEELNSIIV